MNEPEAQSEAEGEPQPGSPTPSDLKPQIAKRAYEHYEERGHQPDPAIQVWEQAERENRKDQAKAAPKPEGKTAPSSWMNKEGLLEGVLVLIVLAALVIGFGLGRWWENSKKEQNQLVLYGNVDLR
jgi:hypothetical protein